MSDLYQPRFAPVQDRFVWSARGGSPSASFAKDRANVWLPLNADPGILAPLAEALAPLAG